MNSMTTRRSDLLDSLTNTHQSRFRRQPIQQNIIYIRLPNQPTNRPPTFNSSIHYYTTRHKGRAQLPPPSYYSGKYHNDTCKLFLQQMLNYTATMRTVKGLLLSR